MAEPFEITDEMVDAYALGRWEHTGAEAAVSVLTPQSRAAIRAALAVAAPLIAAQARRALLAELIAEADVAPGYAVEATGAPAWTQHWRDVRDWLLRRRGAPAPEPHVLAEWRAKYGPNPTKVPVAWPADELERGTDQ